MRIPKSGAISVLGKWAARFLTPEAVVYDGIGTAVSKSCCNSGKSSLKRSFGGQSWTHIIMSLQQCTHERRRRTFNLRLAREELHACPNREKKFLTFCFMVSPDSQSSTWQSISPNC